MTVLLLTIGSSGDVHPFIGIGQALKQRGHRVRVIVNPHFGDLVHRAGLEFIPLGREAEYDQLRTQPDLWHPRRALPLVMKSIGENLQSVYDAVVQHHVPGETVIAASSLALGARIAQDKFDLPLATVHMAPAVFASAIAPPKLPGLWMPHWLPLGVKRSMFEFGHRRVVDPIIAPAVNAFRARLGLPPVCNVIKDWWNSPRSVIGLWPEWYAPVQPDWPANTVLSGFALYDEADVAPLPPELEQFLAGGEKPIVFTPGTAMHHAHRFFLAAVAVCRQLNRPGILLTRHPDHLPTHLPNHVRHFPYVPLSRLLHRCALIVHHGGIGTTAQALAAAVPQVIVPFSYDQLDNARRLVVLGVATSISPARWSSPRGRHSAAVNAVRSAMTLASEPRKAIASRLDPVASRVKTCRAIENLLQDN